MHGGVHSDRLSMNHAVKNYLLNAVNQKHADRKLRVKGEEKIKDWLKARWGCVYANLLEMG